MLHLLIASNLLFPIPRYLFRHHRGFLEYHCSYRAVCLSGLLSFVVSSETSTLEINHLRKWQPALTASPHFLIPLPSSPLPPSHSQVKLTSLHTQNP